MSILESDSSPPPDWTTLPEPLIAAAKGDGVGAVEVKRAVVRHIANDRPIGRAVADDERAGVDRGSTRIGVGPASVRVAGPDIVKASRSVIAPVMVASPVTSNVNGWLKSTGSG